MPTLQAFVEHYGYLAVFVGCYFEGETVLVIAGFAAHLGYFSLPGVIGTAALAGFCGDQTWYAVGRRYGKALTQRYPGLARGATRVQALAGRYGGYAAFGLRFLIGLRIAGPLALGAAHFPRLSFAAANAAGAMVWATLFACAGYLFGQAFTNALHHARRYEAIAFVVLAVVLLLASALIRHRARRTS